MPNQFEQPTGPQSAPEVEPTTSTPEEVLTVDPQTPESDPQDLRREPKESVFKKVAGSLGGTGKVTSAAGAKVASAISNRALHRQKLDDLEKRVFGQSDPGTPEEQAHTIEHAFGDDGSVGWRVGQILSSGPNADYLFEQTKAAFDQATKDIPDWQPDASWIIQNEAGQRFNVDRVPIPTPPGEEPQYAMNVTRAEDAPPKLSAEQQANAERIYAGKLTKELSKGKELSEERMEYLFKDLVKRGAESALAQLGTRVEGFKDFQQVMLKMDKNHVHLEATNQILQRKEGLLDKMVERIPSRSLRETIRSSVKSGLIGGGVVVALGLMGGPVSWGAFAAAWAGGAGARWLATHQAREKQLFRPQKEGEASLADQAFEKISTKIGSAHKAAIEADERAKSLDDGEAKIERAKAAQAIIKQLRQREESGVLQQFCTKERAASLWETGASLTGSWLGAGIHSTVEAAQKIAQAKAQGIQILDGHITHAAGKGHLVRELNGQTVFQYNSSDLERVTKLQEVADKGLHGLHGGVADSIGAHYMDAGGASHNLTLPDLKAALGNNIPIYHGVGHGAYQASEALGQEISRNIIHPEIIETALAAGAMSAGSIWTGLRTGQAGFWNRKQAEKALTYAYKQSIDMSGRAVASGPEAKKSVVEIGRAKPGAQHVEQPIKEHMDTRFEYVLNQDSAEQPFIANLLAGERLNPASTNPRSIDWLLGGFGDRDALLAELPDRLAYAESWLKDRLATEGNGQLGKKIVALQEGIEHIKKEINAKGIGEQFHELSTICLFEKLSTQFSAVDDLMFKKPVPEDARHTQEYYDLLIAKAGAKDAEKASPDLLKKLQRFLELKGGLDDSHRSLRDQIAGGLALTISRREKAFEAEETERKKKEKEKEKDEADRKNNQQGKKNR